LEKYSTGIMSTKFDHIILYLVSKEYMNIPPWYVYIQSNVTKTIKLCTIKDVKIDGRSTRGIYQSLFYCAL
jgi:hypothetical protein